MMPAETNEEVDVVVIGGGVSGLACAHRMQERAPAQRVLVLEASAQPGGLLQSTRVGEFLVEEGPDSIVTDKPEALTLAKALGLDAQLIKTEEAKRGVYVVKDGQLIRLPAGFSMLTPTDWWPMFATPLLSWPAKLRAAMDLILPRGRAKQEESLEAFVTRRFGRELLEQLAAPLASGVYGTPSNMLSMQAALPRFVRMEAQHRSVSLGAKREAAARISKAQRPARPETNGGTTRTDVDVDGADLGGANEGGANEGAVGHGDANEGVRYGLFMSFREGMSTLPRALAASIGDGLRTETRVERIEPGHKRRFRVCITTKATTNIETIECDAVVLAVPTHIAAKLCLSLSDPRLTEALEAIPYGSTAALTLGWRDAQHLPRPLDAFGFVVPAREGVPIIAATWSSTKYAGRAPAKGALMRVYVGGSAAHAWLASRESTANKKETPSPAETQSPAPSSVSGDLSKQRALPLRTEPPPEAKALAALVMPALERIMGPLPAPDLIRAHPYGQALPQYTLGHKARISAIDDALAAHAGLHLASNARDGVSISDAIRAGQNAAEAVVQATVETTRSPARPHRASEGPSSPDTPASPSTPA